jgi:hypothetical protein
MKNRINLLASVNRNRFQSGPSSVVRWERRGLFENSKAEQH